jgi:hypothetical protein
MKVSNGLDLQAQKIVNLADPSAGTDGANKQYVDNVARGLSWKLPARAATTTNGALATAYANGQSVDGVVLATGDRILLKNQTAGAENGIYTVNASGAPTRALDADNGSELNPGTTVPITEGTTNADKAFFIVSDAFVTIGTTATVWGQLGGGNTYTGSNGVQLVGADFRAQVVAAGGVLAAAGGLSVDPAVVARKASANIGNGALTSIPFAHNLNTQDVHVSVREVATQAGILCDWVATDANTVTLTFGSAPAANAFRVTVIG